MTPGHTISPHGVRGGAFTSFMHLLCGGFFVCLNVLVFGSYIKAIVFGVAFFQRVARG